jgi:hypothetical protein
MAGFCSKCGTSLSSSTGFCPACGTPIAADAVPPPVTPPPASPQPFVPPPVMSCVPPQPGPYPVYQQKSSGGALKIILIVIAVIVVLGVGAVGIAGFVAYRAMHAAGSSLSIGKNVDESDLGVAVYPGATHIDAGGMKMKVGNNLVVSSTYTTSDPASSVVTFYHDKLGGAVQESDTSSGTSLVSTTLDAGVKDNIVINVTPGSSGAVTRFVIVHTKTSSN